MTKEWRQEFNACKNCERLEAALERERTAAEAEITRLNKMRVHCENCGADYMATGIEAGCSCRLQAQLTSAAERERVLKEALQALYDHSRRSRFKADAYLWEQARAALVQKGGCDG